MDRRLALVALLVTLAAVPSSGLELPGGLGESFGNIKNKVQGSIGDIQNSLKDLLGGGKGEQSTEGKGSNVDWSNLNPRTFAGLQQRLQNGGNKLKELAKKKTTDLTPAEIEKMPAAIFAMKKRSELEKMSEPQKTSVCKNMIKNLADSDVFETIQKALNNFCDKQLAEKTKTGGELPREFARLKLQEVRKSGAKPSAEVLAIITSRTELLRPADINNKNIVDDVPTLTKIMEGLSRAKNMHKDMRKAVEKKAKDLLGTDISSWDAAKQKLAAKLGLLSDGDTDKLKLPALAESLKELRDKNSNENSRHVQKKLLDAIKKATQNGKTIDQDTADKALPSLLRNPSFCKEIDENILLSALAKNVGNIDKRLKAACLKEIGQKKKLKNGEKLTKQKFAETKLFLDDMKDADLETAEVESLLKDGDMKGIPMSKRVAKKFVGNLLAAISASKFPKFEAWTAGDIDKAKSLIKGMDASNIRQIPASVRKQKVSELLPEVKSPIQLRALLDELDVNDYVDILGEDFNEMAMSEIKKLSKDALKAGNKTDFKEPKCLTRGRAMAMWNHLIKTLRNPEDEGTEFDTETLKKWSPCIKKAVNMEMLNKRSLAVLKIIFENFDDIEDLSQLEMIAKALVANLQAKIEELTEDDVQTLGPFLQFLKPSDIRKILRTEALKKAVADVLTQNEINKLLHPKTLRELLEIVMEIHALKNKGSLDADDLDKLGGLKCGLNEKEISELTNDAAQDMANESADCPVKRLIARAIIERMKKINAKLDPELLSLLKNADIAEIDNMDKTKLAENLMDLLDSINDDDKRMKAMEQNNIEVNTDADKSKIEESTKKLLQTAQEGYVDQLKVTTQRKKREASRRRRATNEYNTCSSIKLLGNQMTALSETTYSSMPTEEYKLCVDTFGTVGGWNKKQLEAHMTKAKAAYGAPSTWTESDVSSMGSTVAGLTAAEIKQLPLTKTDTMNSIGMHGLMNHDQNKAGFERFMSQSGKTPASLTSGDLESIGHFACGATKTHIDSMTAENVQSAIDKLGQIGSCDREQMKAYVSHIKTKDGANVATWANERVAQLGHMLGGLETTDVPNLTTAHINSVTSNVIKHLPTDVFKSFTETQFKAFDANQLGAITEDQFKATSGEMQNLLNKLRSNMSGTGAGNTVVASCVLLLMSVIITMA